MSDEALKKVVDAAYSDGVRAGRMKPRINGCCCAFEEDGETIARRSDGSLQMCAAHEALKNQAVSEAYEKAARWPDDVIDLATQLFCHGLPLPKDGENGQMRMTRGLCVAPNCNCWEDGRRLTRAVLEAASRARITPAGRSALVGNTGGG